MGKVWIWDSNPFNPYAAEVSRVVASSGRRVVRVCRKGDPWVAKGVEKLFLFPKPSEGKHSLFVKARYLFSLVSIFAVLLVRRPLLIVPWITNAYEARTLLALQRLGLRSIVIVHNPIAHRDEARSRASPVHEVRRRAVCLVVHREDLRDCLLEQTLGDHALVRVAGHPAYFGWLETMVNRVGDPAVGAGHKSPVALFVGAAREDKGFCLLPKLSQELSARGLRLGVSVGILSPANKAVLERCVNSVIYGDGSSYISDDDLFKQMRSARVLVAPYRDVTVSGTVIMALTIGLPVVSFASDGMLALFSRDQLAAPDDLGELADLASRSAASEPEAASLAMQLDRASAEQWKLVLDHYGPPRV